jgi:hypothetical protein
LATIPPPHYAITPRLLLLISHYYAEAFAIDIFSLRFFFRHIDYDAAAIDFRHFHIATLIDFHLILLILITDIAFSSHIAFHFSLSLPLMIFSLPPFRALPHMPPFEPSGHSHFDIEYAADANRGCRAEPAGLIDAQIARIAITIDDEIRHAGNTSSH